MDSSFRQRLKAEWPRKKSSILMAAFGSATLGLAPFLPHPHVYKQLANLWHGRLTAPIDIFDLFFHGAPWIWLLATLLGWVRAARRA